MAPGIARLAVGWCCLGRHKSMTRVGLGSFIGSVYYRADAFDNQMLGCLE
jgi:hypothetical protein